MWSPTGAEVRQWPSGGYRYVYLSTRARPNRVFRTVHRLVLEAFSGPCPPGLEASHLNEDSTDNRASNLAWETRAENMARRRSVPSPKVRGAANGRAKMTAEQVLELRKLRAAGATYRELAARYGVAYSTARAASVGRRWTHLDDS